MQKKEFRQIQINAVRTNGACPLPVQLTCALISCLTWFVRNPVADIPFMGCTKISEKLVHLNTRSFAITNQSIKYLKVYVHSHTHVRSRLLLFHLNILRLRLCNNVYVYFFVISPYLPLLHRGCLWFCRGPGGFRFPDRWARCLEASQSRSPSPSPVRRLYASDPPSATGS